MEVTLKAKSRSDKGKGPARRARAAGKLPAVLYGASVEPTALMVDLKEMSQALHTEAGTNVLINLEVDSNQYLTIPREIQRHPVRGTLLHVDFLSVARDVQIGATVPVLVIGESHGVKEGGQIDQHIHELKIEALPSDIPPSIEVDITELGIGESLKVSDMTVPPGVTVLNDPADVVVAVVEPQALELEEEAPAAEEGEVPVEGEEAATPAPDEAESSAPKE